MLNSFAASVEHNFVAPLVSSLHQDRKRSFLFKAVRPGSGRHSCFVEQCTFNYLSVLRCHGHAVVGLLEKGLIKFGLVFVYLRHHALELKLTLVQKRLRLQL